jgi:hypothetical protein
MGGSLFSLCDFIAGLAKASPDQPIHNPQKDARSIFNRISTTDISRSMQDTHLPGAR